MVTFKLGQKVLLLFIIVALVPLLAVSFLLLNIAQKQLKQDATSRQQLTADKTAESVDNFLASKVNVLIFQSQTASARQFRIPDVSLNLAAMIKQDRDMERVELVDKNGNERVVINRTGLVQKHTNVANNDAFKATTFLAGKEYIGPVTYDSKGQPHITMAVPMIRFTQQQDLTNLSTAEFGKYRTQDDIQGVLMASFSLSDLWQSVLSTRIGLDGYAYVVDDKGNLIAYPDNNFLTKHQNLSQVHQVADFLKGAHDVHESESETGVPVLSAYQPITRSNWAVIVEEPISSVFAGITAFYRVAIIIFVGIASFAISLSLLFRKQLLRPIKQLAAAAKRIGGGDFNYTIPDSSHDELGDLARTFNHMGHNVKSLVTDLQVKNANLGIEQNKLSSIIHSVSDGIIAIDHDQRIISINPPAALLVGRKPHELDGKLLTENFPWKYQGRVLNLDVNQPGVYHYDALVLTHGNQVAYLDLVVTITQDRSSQVAAIITIHNLTQSLELEIMKLDFVAIAAHELRTPLTVVRGYLNLMNADAINQLSIYNIENLQRALIGAEQLSNLINNLLNISRIERGEMHIVISKADIADIASKTTRQQQITAKLKEQKLNYIGPHSGVFVPADVSAISEVINNLVSNALKYTQPGGIINVTLATSGDQVHVAVQDNGPGIPDAAQDRLFTKFYRVEHSLTSGNRGTGLGLFISKTIIDLHHGKIQLSSKVGDGSTFSFSLPIFQEAKHANLIAKTKESIGVHGWIKKRSTR